MRSKIAVGTVSMSAPIYVTNSSVGGGLGSLVFNSAGLVGEYRRAGQSSWTSITLAAGTLGTWSSGGWIADGSLAGAYEVGIPNAALASGAAWVQIRYYGATNMTPVLLYLELDAVNYQDAVHFGLSAIPNASPGGSGGLFIAGSNAATTVSITGSLSGSVGSVTGNVGGNVGGSVASVTGNVGGSVASVTAPVSVSLTETLSAPRVMDAVADGSITLNDALWGAIVAAFGKEAVSGTNYTVSTPSTGTLLRTFILDQNPNPNSRS